MNPMIHISPFEPKFSNAIIKSKTLKFIKMKAMTTKQTMDEIVRVFNNHDAEAFASLYSNDATAYDPQYADILKGKEAIKKDIEDFFTAFPDVHAKVLRSVADNETVAFELEVTGTHMGPMVSPDGPIPATNKAIKMLGSRFIRVNKGGKICECNRYFDMAGVAQQLGLMQ